MKIVSIMLTVALVTCGAAAECRAQRLVGWDDLVMRDGLWYEADSEIPFTGVAVEYRPGGQKAAEIEIRYGIVEGKAVTWHENGRKQSEGELRNGREHGEWTFWHENGEVEAEIEYENGNVISGEVWDERGYPENMYQVETERIWVD